MLRIHLTFFAIVLSCSQLFSQLRFPVEKGYIKSRDTHYPVQDIMMEGGNDSVYASESGLIISVFDVEGEHYILMKGRYFIGYGPFVFVEVKRLDSVGQGKFLGKIAVDKDRSKYLDMMIMETADKKLLLENVFAPYVRKE